MTALSKPDLVDRLEAAEQISDFVLGSLDRGYTALAIAKRLQEELLEFTDTHPIDLRDAITELDRRKTPLTERLERLTQVKAIDRSVARQLEVSTPRSVLEKLLFLTLQRIEMEHGFELEMDDSGEVFLRGKEKSKSKLSGGMLAEMEMARRLIKDLTVIDAKDGKGTIDGQLERREREEEGMNAQLAAKFGRLAKHLLESPEVLDEPIDVEFNADTYEVVDPPRE